MNFATASSKPACRLLRAGADTRALAIVAMTMVRGVVVLLPPRSPDPGRP